MKLPFDPVKNGWHFPVNVIADAMGVKRSNGLCGGMSLAAVNYFRYGINIPAINSSDIKQVNKTPHKNLQLPAENSKANIIFNFILNSQFAVFESPNIIRQQVLSPFPNTKENHHLTSINDEFQKIKQALNDNCFVIMGLRTIKKDCQACHQTLVYGYDDKNCTLYMYDSNNPNEEITVKSNGYRLIFSNGKDYASYYLLVKLNSNTKSELKEYDSVKNQVYNFAVKPPMA